MGIRPGKVNFCLQAFIEKGCRKLSNFRNNPLRLLTPHGIEQKFQMIAEFVRIKDFDAVGGRASELSRITGGLCAAVQK